MTKVSVIIPVYNTEDYLEECLDSIINQTLTDMEIICIDDGSSDNSLEILKEYEKNDSRINIITQENNGLAFTRNVGLKSAKGEYVYFMDSDDILEIEALEELYGLCQKDDLDMVIFKMINFDDETRTLYTRDYYEMDSLKETVHDNVFNYDDITEEIVKIAVSSPGKFFKRSLISDMEFPEGLIFEDNPFFVEAMFKADKVLFHDKHLYKRRVRNESITTSNDLKFSDTLKISDMIIELAKEYGHYDELKDAILNRKIDITFYRFSSVGDIYKKEFFEMIKEDFSLIKDDVETSNISHDSRYIFDMAMECEDGEEFEVKVKYYKKRYLKKLHGHEFIRLDMKNEGGKNNSIDIVEYTDKYLQINEAPWLTNETGNGFFIESHRGELDLKLKMINDGKVNLRFRGTSIRDKNNNRMKIKVDCTSLVINKKPYLEGHNLLDYDNMFTFKKDVKDSEIIDVHIEWMTYDKMSSYVEEINEYEKLFNQSKSRKLFKKISNFNKN
ncbi:glycosyltransferase family 2 protein [Methanobrevibacter sp.]|uniref:glycosyltransferase family 2 protein n=1 Tax=Methanobrevibacter sp. TaxID=66852 RepID=UPI0038691D9C